MLKDDHEDIREYAALTIGDLGPKAAVAVSPLMESLCDPVWYVRSTIAWVLGQIGPGARKANACLIECLNDDEIEVRMCATEALASLCQPDDTNVLCALEEAAVSDMQPPAVREKAREVLTKVKNMVGDYPSP
jgi:HEAT repeat protein